MSVSVWSHPLYRWYNTHSLYDITSTVYMAQYALYMTSHPWFMTSQHSTHDITTLYSWHQSYYISPHTDYIWQHIHCICQLSQIIDHTTQIVCMITQLQYVWHHMNYIWHHIHSLWYHSTLWHHTHCKYVITPRIPVIASSAAGPLLIVYWLYHTYYMYDMNPTICMTSQEFYMTSHSLFMT